MMKTVAKGIEKKLTKLLTKVRKTFPHADVERVDFHPDTTILKDRVVFMMDSRPQSSGSVFEYEFTDKHFYYGGDFYKHPKDIKKIYKNEHRPCNKRKTYKIEAYKDGRMTQVITKVKEV